MTTFDESRVRRVQQGVSTGGQFATQPRTETVVSLTSVDHDVSWPIDEHDEANYTEGLCHVLAHALHQASGWPIVVVGDGPDGVVGWVHAGVRRPDGKIVDIRGAHDEGDWLEEWGAHVDADGEDDEDFDSEAVSTYPLADYGPDHDPAELYEAMAPGHRARAEAVARMLLAEHA